MYTKDPIEFINLINNAEYVITTSFHATAFSIILEKKFITVPNEKTGSRMINLLNKLNLEDRIIKSIEEAKKNNWNKDINYEQVKNILEKERKKSIDFLKRSIEE